LFLFYNSEIGHYELITFDFENRKINLKNSKLIGTTITPTKKITIFDRKNNNIIPPLYILLTIFGSYYYNLDDESKNDFSLLSSIMNVINSSLNNFLSKYTEQNKVLYTKIINIFNLYFPNIKLQLPTKSNEHLITNIEDYFGGANQYGNQYRNQYGNQYRRQSMAQEMVKPEYKKESTQIAYYISIDMELQEGTTLTEEDKKNIKCRIKWNAVRKAYAEFTGKPYTIAPFYQNNKTNKANKRVTNTSNNYTKTKKNTGGKISNINRYTRKTKI
jgi:hypothetical protein